MPGSVNPTACLWRCLQAATNGIGGHSPVTVALVSALGLLAIAASTPGPDYEGEHPCSCTLPYICLVCNRSMSWSDRAVLRQLAKIGRPPPLSRPAWPWPCAQAPPPPPTAPTAGCNTSTTLRRPPPTGRAGHWRWPAAARRWACVHGMCVGDACGVVRMFGEASGWSSVTPSGPNKKRE